MAKVNVSFSLTCPCGHCSDDVIDIAVHLDNCKEIDKLPPWLAKWLKGAVHSEADELR